MSDYRDRNRNNHDRNMGQSRHRADGGLDLAQFDEDFFVYGQSFGNIVAGATTQKTLTIDGDAHFKLIKLAAFGTLHGIAAGTPLTDNTVLEINLSLRDGSGRDLFGTAIPIGSIAGSGREPFIMPIQRIFRAKTNLIMSATNFGAANQYDNIFLSLIGTKLFEK